MEISVREIEETSVNVPNARRKLRAFLPFALAIIVSVATLLAIMRISPPSTAGDWGSLLSAVVALVALGAFTSTIILQTEELALQRKEISNLAISAKDQGNSLRRQTTIESYRIVDEKVEALFSDSDFKYLLDFSQQPSTLKHMISEIELVTKGVSRVNFRGIQNISNYKFITPFHHFPITILEKDAYGGDGEAHSVLLPISSFCILYLLDAAQIAGHVYKLAQDLDLEDYARSVMQRRTLLEAPLYIAITYGYLRQSESKLSIRIAPGVNAADFEDTIRYHVEEKLKFYNNVTASLAGEEVIMDILSPQAEAPFARP